MFSTSLKQHMVELNFIRCESAFSGRILNPAKHLQRRPCSRCKSGYGTSGSVLRSFSLLRYIQIPIRHLVKIFLQGLCLVGTPCHFFTDSG